MMVGGHFGRTWMESDCSGGPETILQRTSCDLGTKNHIFRLSNSTLLLAVAVIKSFNQKILTTKTVHSVLTNLTHILF